MSGFIIYSFFRWKIVFQGMETSMSVHWSGGVEGGLEVQEMRPVEVSYSTRIYQYLLCARWWHAECTSLSLEELKFKGPKFKCFLVISRWCRWTNGSVNNREWWGLCLIGESMSCRKHFCSRICVNPWQSKTLIYGWVQMIDPEFGGSLHGERRSLSLAL